MKTTIIVLAVVVIAGGIYFWWGTNKNPVSTAATSFDECISQGNPVMESYPRQCRDKAGTLLKEDIGNELDKTNLIKITSPRPNQIISSPATIKGEARGNWYFEASFPVKILDQSGNQIGQGIAQAKEDWMTENFVPFEAVIQFTKPITPKGFLILEKDNPSGLPEHDDRLIVPIKF